MRQTKDSKPDEIAQQEEEDLELSLDSDSELDDDESVVLTVSKRKNLFLTKVGITFMVYFLVAFFTCVYILIDVRRTTTFYRAWSLATVLWVFLAVSVFIKLSMGLFGKAIRKLAVVVFLVDCVATVMVVLGLYYYLDSFRDSTNYTYAPLVVVFSLNLLVSSFFFTLTTLYQSRSKQYNYILGIVFTTLFNIGTIVGLFFGWNQVVTITRNQYIVVGLLMLVFNCYLSLNSYFLINLRTDNFKEDDAIWAFYCYFTDLLFPFWKNLVSNNQRAIKLTRKRDQLLLDARQTKEGKDGKEGKEGKPKNNDIAIKHSYPPLPSEEGNVEMAVK